MKKSRFTDEQIIGFRKQVEGGLPVKDLCRRHGFSDATFYKWRSRLGSLASRRRRATPTQRTGIPDAGRARRRPRATGFTSKEAQGRSAGQVALDVRVVFRRQRESRETCGLTVET
jgi:transposase-like protein